MAALGKFSSSLVRLVSLLLLCASVQAQTGVITSTIVDETTAVIPRAHVSLAGAKQKAETTTDSVGHFRFEKLPGDTYELEVQMPGFRTQRLRSFLLNENQTLEIPPIPLFVGSTGCGSPGPPHISPLSDPKQSIVTGRMLVERDSRTQPLRNSTITLVANDRTVTAKTDGDGRYRVEAPPGSYLAQAGRVFRIPLTFFKGWEADYGDFVDVQAKGIVVCE